MQQPPQQPAQQYQVTSVTHQHASPLQQHPTQMPNPAYRPDNSMGVNYTGFQEPSSFYQTQNTQPSKKKKKNKKPIWPAIVAGVASMALITGLILYFVLTPDEPTGAGANNLAGVTDEQVEMEGMRQSAEKAREEEAKANAKRSSILSAIESDIESFNKEEKESRDFSNGNRKIKTVIASFDAGRNELIYFYEVTGFNEGGEDGIQFFENKRNSEMLNPAKHAKWRRNGIDIIVKYEMDSGKETQLMYPAIRKDEE